MRKKMAKFMCILLSLLLLFSVTGCGKSSGNTSGELSTETSSVPAAP